MKLIKTSDQDIWFTSDTHYHHKNICKATTKWINADSETRDFPSLDKMNDTLVNNINRVVKPDDILFHLGDWSFSGIDKMKEFRSRLVCQNIHLIYGNHDTSIMADPTLQVLFSSVQHYLELDIRMYTGQKQHKLVFQQEIILCHYPIQSWNHMNKGSIHLHGHVHLPFNKRLGKGKMMDVGVDGNNMMPLSLLEVMRIMAKQPIKANFEFDHHIKDLETGKLRS